MVTIRRKMILSVFSPRNSLFEVFTSKNYIPCGKIMSNDHRYDNEAYQLLKNRVIRGQKNE